MTHPGSTLLSLYGELSRRPTDGGPVSYEAIVDGYKFRFSKTEDGEVLFSWIEPTAWTQRGGIYVFGCMDQHWHPVTKRGTDADLRRVMPLVERAHWATFTYRRPRPTRREGDLRMCMICRSEQLSFDLVEGYCCLNCGASDADE